MLPVCSTFIWLAPLSTHSTSSSGQSMHNFMNLCCSVLYKKYKSELIKSGKDLFPGVSETERLAEQLGYAALTTLPLQCRRSPAKMDQCFAPGFRILSQPHIHTETHSQSICLASQPDTTAAIHNTNQRQVVRNDSVAC